MGKKKEVGGEKGKIYLSGVVRRGGCPWDVTYTTGNIKNRTVGYGGPQRKGRY